MPNNLFLLILRIVGPALFWMLTMAPSFAETRIALVIGNSNYRSVPVLQNPASDANDIGDALARLGFSVQRLQDANFDQMRRALLTFGPLARNAEMAVIFFAGHGMEVGGENWLIPTDAELKSDIDTENEAIGLKSLVLTVAGASKLGLVVLDACRNNPFSAKMQRTARARSVERGLARIEPSGSVLVAYAAKDGTVAADGTGRNSPFTSALLKYLELPNLEINFLFRNVRDDVIMATNRAQEPYLYGSLSSEAIYLKTTGLIMPVRPSPTTSPATPVVGVFSATRAKKPLSRSEERLLKQGDSFKECDDCPEMVVVPAGSFMLGSPSDETRRLSDEGPRTKVTIASPFAVGKFEVTLAQFKAFASATGYQVTVGCQIWSQRLRTWDRRTALTFWSVGFAQGDDHPVVCVNWDDANAFVAWLANGTGKKYRLLTEAEWEYSARAGTSTPFSMGSTISTDQANFDGNAIYNNGRKGISRHTTVPVNSFSPNPWGLFNMHGNVWEWVEDCYAREDYKYLPAAVRDGGAAWPGTCGSDEHSIRGGSWLDDPEYLRSARRVEIRPAGRLNYLGFRVARTINK
jgi:formylglycine-generating enzyme required for sulfatase activity